MRSLDSLFEGVTVPKKRQSRTRKHSAGLLVDPQEEKNGGERKRQVVRLKDAAIAGQQERNFVFDPKEKRPVADLNYVHLWDDQPEHPTGIRFKRKTK